MLRSVFVTPAKWYTEHGRKNVGLRLAAGIAGDSTRVQALQEQVSQLSLRGRDVIETAGIRNSDRLQQLNSELKQQSALAERDVAREPDLPATLLVGNEPALFAEVDRLRSESELRLAVVPPLLALTTVLAIKSSLWWLLALVAVSILQWQGFRRRTESRKLILDALTVGRTASPSLKQFSDWVEDLRRRVQEEVERQRRGAVIDT
jgi:hypothetical protein